MLQQRMVKKTQITKKQLFAMFPYLKEEVEYVKNTREDRDGWADVHDHSSKLESAVLIEERKKDLPDPDYTTYSCNSDFDEGEYVNERQVDLVDKHGKRVRELKP